MGRPTNFALRAIPASIRSTLRIRFWTRRLMTGNSTCGKQVLRNNAAIMAITYKDAGVDIEKSNAAKKRIRKLARETFTPGVLSDIGSFGGMFACNFAGMKEPVLVSSTDGVGTKLKVAVMMNRHNTVGADLVNHCINDILVQGAKRLFFMDYVATGKSDADVIVSVVEGIARACK